MPQKRSATRKGVAVRKGVTVRKEAAVRKSAATQKNAAVHKSAATHKNGAVHKGAAVRGPRLRTMLAPSRSLARPAAPINPSDENLPPHKPFDENLGESKPGPIRIPANSSSENPRPKNRRIQARETVEKGNGMSNDGTSSVKRTAALGGVVLGEGRTKVIVPVTAETFDEIKEQTASIAKLGGQTASGAGNGVDVVEWRMDFLAPSIDVLSALETLAGFTDLPVLATFRTADEGGKAIEASAYRDLLLAVARSGKVSAIDVEAFRHESTVREVIDGAHEAGVAVLASYHDFHATPAAEEIISRLEAMDAAGADVLKLACMPTSVDDLLVLLNATHRASRTFDRPLITVAMGPIGVLSRIAGGVFGSCATFAAVGRGSAPGQIPVSDLRPALDLLDSAQSATF